MLSYMLLDGINEVEDSEYQSGFCYALLPNPFISPRISRRIQADSVTPAAK